MGHEIDLCGLHRRTIIFPEGVIDCCTQQEMTLYAEEGGIAWLVDHQRETSLLIISPLQVIPDYNPEIYREDMEFLRVKNASELIIACIVKFCPADDPAVNLQDLILINPKNLWGKNVVPLNFRQYKANPPLLRLVCSVPQQHLSAA